MYFLSQFICTLQLIFFFFWLLILFAFCFTVTLSPKKPRKKKTNEISTYWTVLVIFTHCAIFFSLYFSFFLECDRFKWWPGSKRTSVWREKKEKSKIWNEQKRNAKILQTISCILVTINPIAHNVLNHKSDEKIFLISSQNLRVTETAAAWERKHCKNIPFFPPECWKCQCLPFWLLLLLPRWAEQKHYSHDIRFKMWLPRHRISTCFFLVLGALFGDFALRTAECKHGTLDLNSHRI